MEQYSEVIVTVIGAIVAYVAKQVVEFVKSKNREAEFKVLVEAIKRIVIMVQKKYKDDTSGQLKANLVFSHILEKYRAILKKLNIDEEELKMLIDKVYEEIKSEYEYTVFDQTMEKEIEEISLPEVPVVEEVATFVDYMDARKTA